MSKPIIVTWPDEMKAALRAHVETALERLDPDRYAQEPAYVAALLARLDGVVYEGSGCYLEIISTIVADRGPNSAESRWGADFAVIASVIVDGKRTRKAVLGQAKKADVENTVGESRPPRLQAQCEKMLSATSSAIVLRTPDMFGEQPRIEVLATQDEPGHSSIELADYLTDFLLACRHGDRRGSFIRGVSESHLSKLLIVARDNGPYLV